MCFSLQDTLPPAEDKTFVLKDIVSLTFKALLSKKNASKFKMEALCVMHLFISVFCYQKNSKEK